MTGGTSGLGRAVAEHVIERGGRVAVSARDESALESMVSGHRMLGVVMDLTDPRTFMPAIDRIDSAFGGIDVLVNNAGYGLLGAVEETSDQERREQLETNFFGPVTLTSLLLPRMRQSRSAAIVNVSSVSGVRGAPGSPYYSASKHAVEGWSDSLRQELAPFGVHVMVVEPGAFRTDFFGRSRRHTQARLSVYESVELRRRSERETVGTQPGDPRRGARVIVDAIDGPEPPNRLVLGRSAVASVRQSLVGRVEELDRWTRESESADFPGELGR
ncbi:MAG: SDR family NAD(P)-dependent oxidoreductase [Rhodococcus fascians]